MARILALLLLLCAAQPRAALAGAPIVQDEKDAYRAKFKEASDAYGKGQFSESERLALEATEMAVAKQWMSEEAAARTLAGVSQRQTGKYPSAEANLTRSLEIYRGLKIDAEIARSCLNLGSLYATTGKFELAKALYEEARTIRERLGDERGVAASWLGLGIVHRSMARDDLALGAFAKALAINERLDIPREVAACLNNMALIYRGRGQFQIAAKCFLRALETFEKQSNQREIAAVCNNLGGLYSMMGRTDLAGIYHQRALEINEKAENPRSLALSLNSLASDYRSLGQLDRALELRKRALEVREKLGIPQDIAASHRGLAALYGELGKYDLALEHYRKALELGASTGWGARSLGSVQLGTGDVHFAAGDYEKAIHTYREGLDQASGISSRDRARLLERTGASLIRLRRYEDAAKTLREAVATSDDVDLGADPLDQGAGQRAWSGTAHLRLAQALIKLNRTDEALVAIETHRSVGLSKQMNLNQEGLAKFVDNGEAADLLRLERVAAQALARLRTRMRESSNEAAVDSAVAEYEEAKRLLSARRQALFAKYPDFKAVQSEQARPIEDLNQLSKAHPETCYVSVATVAEEFVGVRLHNGKTSGAAHSFSGKASQVIRDYLKLVESDSGGEAAASKTLFDATIGPLLKDLPKGVRRIVVSADAVFQSVPVPALTREGKRLIEDFAVSWAPSLSSLLWKDEARTGKGVLAVGDPTGDSSVGATGFRPLPGARSEAAAVAQGEGSQALVGKDATEEKVRESLGKFGILHFACHGDFVPSDAMASSLVLAPSEPGAMEDGFLQASEVVNMRLNARLVVMSACSTGKGFEAGGEGLMGLAWAFRATGVPSVVAAQWDIDDKSSMRVMVSFYKALSNGQRLDDALREAMLAEMRRSAEPGSDRSGSAAPRAKAGAGVRNWAGFQLIGSTAKLGH